MPFVGAGTCAGRAGPFGGHRRCQGGLVRCCRVCGGRVKASRPPWIRRVGGLLRVRWVPWREWQVVRVQWWLRGVSRVGVAFRGLKFFSLGVVAGPIWFLVGGGRSLVVGRVVGLSVRWVVQPSQVIVLSVHGGVRAGGVGWRAVMVVVGLVVVVVVVVVVVLGVVVVVVLRVCPGDPLALKRDLRVRHHSGALGAAGLGGYRGWLWLWVYR